MIRILHGDCREMLATLPDASVQCCVTSPPYWGLRDYGVVGQIGLEASPDAYVAEMVAVFREVRRVLRDDGTLWLNLGDSYFAGHGGSTTAGNYTPKSGSYTAAKPRERDDLNVASWGVRDATPKRVIPGFKPKDLMMIPARVALALQADGWWLRSDIIWAKKNCMPESVTDRPSQAHEHVFLLTKSARYFYDAEAIREEGVIPAGTRAAKGSSVRSDLKDVNGRPPEYWDYTGTRNARNVWSIATKPFADAHFATFPPELAERCISAGSSEHGCCSDCGAPWVRDVQTTSFTKRPNSNGIRGQAASSRVSGSPQRGSRYADHATTGWQPSCQCSASVVPCTVLDPFAGAFTTAMVADRLQRNAIGIELNPEYCAMAERRLVKDAGMFAEIV